jgi:hypothetical protein
MFFGAAAFAATAPASGEKTNAGSDENFVSESAEL